MTYEEWVRGVPQCIVEGGLWRIEAYRLGLFIYDLAWQDCSRLLKERRARELSDQLIRAADGISLTIAEGFSRNTGVERARFYEFALGSARELRDAYYKARHVLGSKVSDHRMALATSIVRLLLRMVPEQRRVNRRLSTSGGTSRNH